MANAVTNITTPAWARIRVDGPRSGQPMPSQFQVDVQRLTHMSNPERAGPVVTVLQNTDFLLQCVLSEPWARKIALFDFAALTDLRSRLTEGLPTVTEQLTEVLAASANVKDRIHDGMSLAESFMVLERCLDSLPTGTFKSMVEGFMEQPRKQLDE